MACLAFAGVAAGQTLTVATYNVENYGLANRMTESGFRRDYPKPEPEKRALRSVIRGIGADVLVLQEIGGRSFLEELQRDLRGDGMDYPHAELGEGSDAERHVAVLSRVPLKAVRSHVRLEFSYLGGRETVKRGVLEAVFGIACGLRGVVTWEQVSFGIFTAVCIAAAYLVFYPRKEAE